jgi:restriction system protein
VGRRKRSSFGEDLRDLVALMPWWVVLVLGVAAFFALHWLAQRPLPSAVAPAQVGSFMAQTYVRALAMAGQVVIPIICFAAAAVSAMRRRRQKLLYVSVTGNPAADALDGISWQEFEQLVAEGFRLQGYRVLETGGGGADGGVDLVVSKDGDKWLVQCKQWRAFKVGVTVVRELYGVMAAQGAAGGFVITSGKFTDEARAFAEGRNVRLMDGIKLRAMLREVQAAQGKSAGPTTILGSSTFGPAVPSALVPACPVCGRPMTRRIARKGAAQAGEAFWGCTGFPACRGTKPLAPSR